MNTAIDIQLLNRKLILPDLSIGQAIDIAKIPERFNERRISALIDHLSGEIGLAETLTVQERYFALINYQMLANHRYSEDRNYEQYLLPTIENEVPEVFDHPELPVSIQHLRGRHAVVLESKCEDIFDWLCGQMACQLYGEWPAQLTKDTEKEWEPLDLTMTENELSAKIFSRYELIIDLPALNDGSFNEMFDVYAMMQWQLTHLVDISNDNNGITILPSIKGGDGDFEPARFHPLADLEGTAKRLAELVAK
ncbi:MAG: hypothetical protein Q4P13_05830 [Psychrobacter sp.]|nr:hypothetical protein [Psychrobacter sp.]